MDVRFTDDGSGSAAANGGTQLAIRVPQAHQGGNIPYLTALKFTDF
jgi:hypothetical protein